MTAHNPESARPSDPALIADDVRPWLVEWVNVQPGVKADVQRLAERLVDGFEPFAVTQLGHSFVYHLRRRTDG